MEEETIREEKRPAMEEATELQAGKRVSPWFRGDSGLEVTFETGKAVPEYYRWTLVNKREEDLVLKAPVQVRRR